jgi:hypothetical protein
MAKPLSVSAWFKQLPPPTDANKRTEAAFLQEHWEYGGRVHEETVEAIVAELAKPSEVAVGHGLFLRLFAECANALETLGAWGWTIRNRRDFPLLLDGFLAYPHSAPREFFQAEKRNRSGSLVLLLKLPPEERLIPALADGFTHWTRADCKAALAETFTSLRQSADHYFAEDEIFRTTYNKAKHGATMLRTADMDARQFYVLAPHLVVRGKRDKARYDLSKFTVNKTMIGALQRRTELIGTTIRVLAGIARALLQADLLYPRQRRGN